MNELKNFLNRQLPGLYEEFIWIANERYGSSIMTPSMALEHIINRIAKMLKEKYPTLLRGSSAAVHAGIAQNWISRNGFPEQFRDPELESIIVQSPDEALKYTNLLGYRWPEGERSILKSPEATYLYSVHFLNSYKHLTSINHDRDANQIFKLYRWPEGEKVIATSAEYSYRYALEAIKGRWEEGEEAIKTSPWYAREYATRVLKAPWPEAEDVIASSVADAYSYAHKFYKGIGWPKAEKTLLQSPEYVDIYIKNVLKKRWPEGEAAIIARNNPTLVYKHLSEFLNGKLGITRWPEAEKVLLRNPGMAASYAMNIMKQRWPEAEEIIKTNPKLYARYLRSFGQDAEKTLPPEQDLVDDPFKLFEVGNNRVVWYDSDDDTFVVAIKGPDGAPPSIISDTFRTYQEVVNFLDS